MADLLIRPLLSTAISPNAITSVGLVFGLGAFGCYAAGGAYGHFGAVLFMAAYVLDHADGEYARLTGRTSDFGHNYDLVADAIVVIGLFVGIGIGLRGSAFSVPTAWLGVIAGVSIALIFLVRFDLERRFSKTATRQPNLLGFEVQDVLYLVGPITWFGWLHSFIVAAAIGAPIFAMWACWDCWSRYRHHSGGP